MSAVECATTKNVAFDVWTKAVQAQVETALSRYLPPPHSEPRRLHEAMRYAVLDGGKRVRPLLVHAAGTLFPASDEWLQRAAVAVELIHAYSLVHDDMPCMDDDALRRGKPTVHKQFDEATALLTGDALQTLAFSILSEHADADAAQRSLYMVRTLAQASGSLGMCGGQAIDLDSVGLQLSRPQLEQMHRLKTGALLRASVLMGAACAGVPDIQISAALDNYSQSVGLAFQVVDDILDATADSATLGKTAGKDAANSKPTYVSIIGLDASRALVRQLQENAHQALSVFGASGQRLRELADLIVERKA